MAVIKLEKCAMVRKSPFAVNSAVRGCHKSSDAGDEVCSVNKI